MDNQTLTCCSIAFSQVIRQAAVDVLGHSEAANLPRREDGCILPGALIEALEQRYGATAAKGIAQRMGRAAFLYFLDFYGSDLNLTGMEYRLLPYRRRLQAGLQVVSRKLAEECGAEINQEADASAYYWQISWQRGLGDGDVRRGFSYFLAGMAQELMSWSGGGKFYNVREMPDSGSCVLKIDQTPLD